MVLPKVTLPESAKPTVYGIDRCPWASDLSTDVVSCPAFCTRRRIFLRIAYSLESGGARAQVRTHIPRWKIRKIWRAIQNKTTNSYVIEIAL
jgi:hypothetical protein